MTQRSEAREALRMKIYDAIDSVSGEIDVVSEDGWPTGDSEITIEGIEYTADIVTGDAIAHLWSRADSEEVAEATDIALASVGAITTRNEDESVIEALLTALIGPRPEQEAPDGQ